MKWIINLIIVIVIITFIIQLISILIVPVGMIAIAIFGYKYFKKKKAQKAANALLEKEQLAQLHAKETIEYKMTMLLQKAQFDPHHVSYRNAYQSKDNLNLLDKWFKYIDLRAKLHLNNTFTSREEAVLHLMCDEVILRLENAEVEVTEHVQKDFIIQHVEPLLTDILYIMEGIRPSDSISINAYQLLNTTKTQIEQERVLEKVLQ